MLNFNGGYPAWTAGNITALTNATVCAVFKTPSSAPGSVVNIWSLDWDSVYPFCLELGTDMKLRFHTNGGILTTIGSWVTPSALTTNKMYYCALAYNFSGSTSYNPTMCLNGVMQTLTEEETPSSVKAHPATPLVVGGRIITLGTFRPWLAPDRIYTSKISDVSIIDRQLNSSEMSFITSSGKKRMTLFGHLEPKFEYTMDNIAHGSDLSSVNYHQVNSDVSGTWSVKTQSTYWESCNSIEGVDYIEADQYNDNAELIMGVNSFTKPTGSIIGITDLPLWGYTSSSVQLVLKILKGATWIDMGSSTFPASSTTPSWIAPSYFGDWTQAELDGAQISMTTPSMGKNDKIRIYFAGLNYYVTPRPCKDGGSTGTSGIVGKSTLGAGEEYAYWTGVR